MPTYTGISSDAFKHPLDYQAEQTLRALPGFQIVASKFVEYFYERPQLIYLQGNSIKANPRQYSTVYGIFRECVRDLDIYPEPNLFIDQNPSVNAYALGEKQPYIVLNTELLELMNEAEIRTIIAHELGHIKCEHTILVQMAMWVSGAASLLGELTLGVGNLISTGLILAFYEWKRKGELSADRAALLVVDDLEIVMTTMMKLAGGSKKYAHECSLKEFEKQANSYKDLDNDTLNQIYKFIIANGGNGTFLSHPFPVERLHYLKEWSSSEDYHQIKQGNYPRSNTKDSVNVEVNSNSQEAEEIKQQIAELEKEIDRLKSEPKD